MIFDRIMLPAQGRNEDYKFAQTGTVTLAASVGGTGGIEPTPSWLENVIKLDSESGFLSVDDWHVKGDLIIEGQVNQWLAQQLVVDDARIQVNRRQDGAVVDSGLVIFDKDTSTEVSSLVYDVSGIWKAGGEAIATKPWVENSATAYNAARLGGVVAANYLRSDVVDQFKHLYTGYRWTIKTDGIQFGIDGISGGLSFYDGSNPYSASIFRDTDEFFYVGVRSGNTLNGIVLNKDGFTGLGIKPTERLHVAGNGLFTGNLTVGGNVGTSDFVSQMQGWRVTPQGQADFRHIFTDELQAKAFTADISQALVGSDVLTKSVAKLAQNWATTANGVTSTIYVEELEGFPGYQVFAVGDRLLLRLFDRSGGGLLIKNIWATVASYVSTANNVQSYTITVNSGGITGQMVYAGSMILDYGTPGSGVIERTVLDQQGSPYSRVSTWMISPDNPENYTLHYQSGNLNGIANAEGWGVYSENSFLTGKLLVGDLTKAGQYMEYKDGVLNIKGQITVTGGNAATKADVDAAIDSIEVGGRNLFEKTNQGITNNLLIDSSAGGATWTLSEEIVDGVRCVKGTKNTAASETWVLFNIRSYTPWKYRANQQYAISFKMKPSFAINNQITRLSTNTNQGLTTNSGSYSLVAGEWNHIKLVVTTLPDFDTILAGRSSVHLRLSIIGNSSTGDTVLLKDIKIEEGNKATDWTPAPEDVPSAVDYLTKALQDGTTEIEGGLINTNVLMVKDTNGAVRGGISGLASDNIGFWAGGTYQAAIDNDANVIFRKDGSFSLAGGKISGTSAGALSVDAGVITGVIESSNYNGTVGSRFDLYNGHLLIGNAIRMSGDVSEIQVRNRDAGLDSFKIGDFPLTPTDFAGAGVDVLLSGTPVTTSPASGSYQLNRTVYVSSSGALTTSVSYIDISLITGGTYNFQAFLKITLSFYEHMYTVLGYSLNERFGLRGGNGIKMQLKNGNTVVWEQNIKEFPENGVIPLFISTSFQAVSPGLQLIITIDGEFEYRVPDGTDTKYYNTYASISRFDSSSRLVLQALLGRMEFSTKGMQAMFSNTNYFRCDNTAIEGRGIQTFISPNGTYRLRISNDGIEKSTNGGTTWTSI